MVAAAIVGGAIIGGVASNAAASKGAKSQESAAARAAQTEMDQYNLNREDSAPWREAGQVALGQLTTGTQLGGEFNRDFTLADFTKDPGYQFRMDEGQRAVDASAAARGGALSGAAIKGAERYGQNFASGEYSNAYNRFNADRTQRFNRLSSIAGIGQTATRDVANQGSQVAANIAGGQIGVGNAQAAAGIAQSNNIQSGMNTLGNWYMQRQYSQPQQSWAMDGGAAVSTQRPPQSDSVQLSDGSTFYG